MLIPSAIDSSRIILRQKTAKRHSSLLGISLCSQSKQNKQQNFTHTNKQHNTIITMTVPAATKLPVMAEESIMAPKEHGTSATPVQSDLRWGCQNQLADR